jgi:hypothetical protein
MTRHPGLRFTRSALAQDDPRVGVPGNGRDLAAYGAVTRKP